ncbi:hypothetical protein [Shumkonia mesophila]|uniref:hypothetical protein n=1 Tax=Shumkonia mesophila TaxID=2838854 RepID=UPI0029350217|nr:hypothetical protein [Shumkonia mesophila]
MTNTTGREAIMQYIIEEVADDAIDDAREHTDSDDSEIIAEVATEMVKNAYLLDVLSAYERDGITREEIRDALGGSGAFPFEPVYDAAFEILEG